MWSDSPSRQQHSFTTTFLSSFLAFAVSLSVRRQERCCQRVPQTSGRRGRHVVLAILLITVNLDTDILDIPDCLQRLD